MRLFALRTDIGRLKKEFITEGEREILTTTMHFLAFVIPFLRATAFAAVVIPVGLLAAWQGGLLLPIGVTVVIGWALVYASMIFNAFVRWKYNVIFVTSEKVVFVRHKSVFSERIDPTHLENIASTAVRSQFMGLVRCGTVLLNLKEREAATTRHVVMQYVPVPGRVAAAIENAIVLMKKRRLQNISIADQEEELQRVQARIGA